jgi:hypothetical protein
MNIVAGIIGAVVGYVFGIFMMEVLGGWNQHDPITSGLLALFVFGPAGAIGGVYLFIWLVMRIRGQTGLAAASGEPIVSGEAALTTDAPAGETAVAPARAITPAPASVAKTGLKTIGIVVGLVALSVGIYAWYEFSTATPWLRPSGVTMQFEIRLAEGVAIPASSQDLKAELVADVPNVNFLDLPATLHRDRFRRDGAREVIVGEVDLAFRTAHRQIDLAIKGRPDRTYQIHLAAKAPHTKELGRWEKHPDGSEIRYRAKWPGED